MYANFKTFIFCNRVKLITVLAAAIMSAAIPGCAHNFSSRSKKSCANTNAAEIEKKFTFAVLADVQYAEKETAGPRNYRTAIVKLSECVADLNTKDLAFVIQLGDLIDGGPNAAAEIDKVLAVYNRLKAEKYHVLGNHDFSGIDRKTMLEKLNIKNPYYYFDRAGFRFVVLDTMDISISGGWPENSGNYRLGEKMLNELKQKKAPNAVDWDGAISEAQKNWLNNVLAGADKKNLKVIILSHLPFTPPGDIHNLWNAEQIVDIFEAHDCVVASFSGHRHTGGYTEQDGIYYVTIEAMVEAPQQNAYAVVNVYYDRLEIKGTGKVPDRTLNMKRVTQKK
jgi:3',5'-cyclic AMP phosphodiesterase CpdA